jgi:hypothetical protein
MDVEQTDIGALTPRGLDGSRGIGRLGTDAERSSLQRGADSGACGGMIVRDKHPDRCIHGITTSTCVP